ncbi:hypothetical protein GCM10023219_29240 [Stakelama sediminis]
MRIFHALCLVLLTACGPTHNSDAGQIDRGNSMIIANDGEVPFDKQYNLSIKLPMREDAFLGLLKKLHLDYTLSGDLTKGLEIPKPRLSNRIKEGDIVRMYQVYGGVDKANRFGRIYRVFVDKSGDVVYIENAFEYPGM